MTHFNNDRNDPIINHLDTVQGITGYGRKQVFRDWVNTMADSFAKNDVAYNERVAEYEAEYPDSTDEIFEHYQRAYVALFRVSRETELDILGEVYEQLGATSDSFGQYFTPNSLAKAMTKMVGAAGACQREATVENPYRVKDGACGSGRFLVHQAYHNMEIQPNEPTVFVGQDIDKLCARMTAVNFAVHGITGHVIQGDSLKAKPQAVWWIQHTNPENGIIEEIEPEKVTSTNTDPSNEHDQMKSEDEDCTSAGDPDNADDSDDPRNGDTNEESEEPESEIVTLSDFG